jgi:hypothetical protein
MAPRGTQGNGLPFRGMNVRVFFFFACVCDSFQMARESRAIFGLISLAGLLASLLPFHLPRSSGVVGWWRVH